MALGVTAQGVKAQQSLDRLTIVAIDRYSISSGDANDRLVNTFVGLLASLREGDPMAFVFTDELDRFYGPLESDADGFAELLSQVSGDIGAGAASAPIDLPSSLMSIYNYMSSVQAREGASVYLVSASPEYAGSGSDMESTLGPIAARGWKVFGATTPGANEALASELESISAGAGGESFALTIPDGIEEFVDRSLRRESRGALRQVGRANLSDSPVFEIDMNIVPSTRWANVLFVREDPETSFRDNEPGRDGIVARATELLRRSSSCRTWSSGG